MGSRGRIFGSCVLWNSDEGEKICILFVASSFCYYLSVAFSTIGINGYINIFWWNILIEKVMSEGICSTSFMNNHHVTFVFWYDIIKAWKYNREAKMIQKQIQEMLDHQSIIRTSDVVKSWKMDWCRKVIKCTMNCHLMIVEPTT